VRASGHDGTAVAASATTSAVKPLQQAAQTGAQFMIVDQQYPQ
jgi:hypothetical protein